MLLNDTLLQTSLVVASIIFTVFTIISAIPSHYRVRRDMAILVNYAFAPFATLSLLSLFAVSFLSLLNSFLELQLLIAASTVILTVSVTIFIPAMGFYCVVLIRMLHPT